MKFKLKKMIPFLDNEELKEIAYRILESDSLEYEGIYLNHLCPFMSKTSNDEIFIEAAKRGYSLKKMAPFVSDEAFHKITELSKNNPDIHIDYKSFYPFMDKTNLSELFIQRYKDNEDASDMLPFVSRQAIHEVVQMYIESPKEAFRIKSCLPFMSSEDASQLFVMSEQKDLFISPKSIFPFVKHTTLQESFMNRLTQKQDVTAYLPFISNEVRDDLVLKYVNDELDIDINAIVPYLNREQLRLVIQYHLKKQ